MTGISQVISKNKMIHVIEKAQRDQADDPEVGKDGALIHSAIALLFMLDWKELDAWRYWPGKHEELSGVPYESLFEQALYFLCRENWRKAALQTSRPGYVVLDEFVLPLGRTSDRGIRELTDGDVEHLISRLREAGDHGLSDVVHYCQSQVSLARSQLQRIESSYATRFRDQDELIANLRARLGVTDPQEDMWSHDWEQRTVPASSFREEEKQE